jgi:hypothetical protein
MVTTNRAPEDSCADARPSLEEVAMFIQVIQGKVADEASIRAAMDRWVTNVEPGAIGFLGSTAGMTDDGTFVAVARFESAEAAQRNSDRPEQGAWWAETEKCFNGPVTFMDCTDTFTWLKGGSDDAKFVQIIEGRSDNPGRMRSLMEQYGKRISEVRPEIIGATFGTRDDGSYVETVYFTSEAEAREHEQMELPDDLASVFAEDQQLMQDAMFLDLHQPMLVSAHQ